MKSTYTLYGTYWDGIKAGDYSDIHFITDYHPNSVSFRKLLSVQDESEYDNLISSFSVNDLIVVSIDYWTDSSNKVMHKFLKKRLGQVVSHLQCRFDNVCCAYE